MFLLLLIFLGLFTFKLFVTNLGKLLLFKFLNFRHFYYSSPAVLFNISLLSVLILIWDPASSAILFPLLKMFNSLQKLCSKNWSSSYCSLLFQLLCPTLSSHRKNAQLIFLYNILFDYVYCPSRKNYFQPPPHKSVRSYHPYSGEVI